MDQLISLFVVLGLILVGFLAGRAAEHRHKRALAKREAAPGPALTNLEHLPDGRQAAHSQFCIGQVVIATDYFKSFAANLKGMIGGRMGMIESLVHRGRREALQRLREQAAAASADLVLNVRLETSMIATGKKKAGSAEVIAYGTAVKLTRQSDE